MSYGEQPGWAPGPPPPNGPYSVYPVPQSNGLAVASLVLGLCSFICFPVGLVAIGLGIAGLSRSRRSGVGSGMSIAGICLGIVGLVFMVTVITVLLVVPSNG